MSAARKSTLRPLCSSGKLGDRSKTGLTFGRVDHSCLGIEEEVEGAGVDGLDGLDCEGTNDQVEGELEYKSRKEPEEVMGRPDQPQTPT